MSADGTAPDARQTGLSLPGPNTPEAITTAGARTVALAKLALAGEVADVRTPSPSSSRQLRRRTKEADHADAVTHPLPPGTTAAAFEKPAEAIPPPELPSQEYDQVVLETRARPTVDEIMTEKAGGQYVYGVSAPGGDRGAAAEDRGDRRGGMQALLERARGRSNPRRSAETR